MNWWSSWTSTDDPTKLIVRCQIIHYNIILYYIEISIDKVAYQLYQGRSTNTNLTYFSTTAYLHRQKKSLAFCGSLKASHADHVSWTFQRITFRWNLRGMTGWLVEPRVERWELENGSKKLAFKKSCFSGTKIELYFRWFGYKSWLFETSWYPEICFVPVLTNGWFDIPTVMESKSSGPFARWDNRGSDST